MPNFSSLAGLKVAEKFVVVVGRVGGTRDYYSNASCFRVGLSWVELRWVLTIFLVYFQSSTHEPHRALISTHEWP